MYVCISILCEGCTFQVQLGVGRNIISYFSQSCACLYASAHEGFRVPLWHCRPTLGSCERARASSAPDVGVGWLASLASFLHACVHRNQPSTTTLAELLRILLQLALISLLSYRAACFMYTIQYYGYILCTTHTCINHTQCTHTHLLLFTPCAHGCWARSKCSTSSQIRG